MSSVSMQRFDHRVSRLVAVARPEVNNTQFNGSGLGPYRAAAKVSCRYIQSEEVSVSLAPNKFPHTSIQLSSIGNPLAGLMLINDSNSSWRSDQSCTDEMWSLLSSLSQNSLSWLVFSKVTVWSKSNVS